jgi:uncharacterized protein (UPF0335 family)
MAKNNTQQSASTQSTQDQLRSYIDRVERLEEEKKALGEDITEVLNEAKSNGYDVKAMREILKIRKRPAHEQQEHEHIVDLYKQALGMI